MSSAFGKKIIYSLFGESHGPYVGITLTNLPAGITIDKKFIDTELKRRRPKGEISTARVELDQYQLISGVMNNVSTGAPLTVLVPNTDAQSKTYDKNLPRPSHADYPAYIKYSGYNDHRGGGHFSGRMTVAIVIAGAIIQTLLKEKGITIGSNILSIGENYDIIPSDVNPILLQKLHKTNFPTFSKKSATSMQDTIEKVKLQGDSIGGVIQTHICGMPVGVGEPFFDSIESILAHLIFSIPGVKGISFGSGFDFAKGYGSQLNDELYLNNNTICTKTNNNGGINGGLSNGMTIQFKTAIKPTPSIFKKQNTVDLETLSETTLELKGRHDPCILHRIAPVIDGITAIGIYELIGE
ncbi:MAG: chorismate synthase [Filifactoraceae bacterium]